ncbi:BlaI/MecI/CopY family transcriptional regulator [Armatimonas sp.]|uniref:BlaI/MecI/CopY family transcriptional regulator n=1 Tax=Armatimonas sp. TaxID=1872638 RepID=UPI00286AFA40|nr:BlaI/MecI/CopY family transcriptional regulator [Armatimonas sp.]
MGRRAGLGTAEAEILRFIQENAPVSVRQVAEQFTQVQRTTVLNVMERLRAKGFLTRERAGCVWSYQPSLPQTQQQRSLVRDFVQQMLGGEVGPFVAYLTEEAELNSAELTELKRLVAALEDEK